MLTATAMVLMCIFLALSSATHPSFLNDVAIILPDELIEFTSSGGLDQMASATSKTMLIPITSTAMATGS